MTIPLVNARSTGARMTVAAMAKSPTFLPTRLLKMFNQEFLVDSVLNRGDPTDSGLVGYFESTPLFIDQDPKVMDEFGEIPVVAGQMGIPKVVRAVRRAFALRISETARRRNKAEWVTTQMVQIKNTMLRAWEDALFSALVANPNVQTLITDTPWGDADSHIRRDVNACRYVIRNAAADANGKQKYGYMADTLVISTESEMDFLDSDEVTKPYEGGNVADQNLKFTGKLPKKFLTLDVVTSWRLSAYIPSGAIVMQRDVVGTIHDERSLEATPMYPGGGGGNGGPREEWRSDLTRASAIAIQNPKACVILTGVTDGENFPTTGDTITATGVTPG